MKTRIVSDRFVAR